jgi:hypothetical protein
MQKTFQLNLHMPLVLWLTDIDTSFDERIDRENVLLVPCTQSLSMYYTVVYKDIYAQHSQQPHPSIQKGSLVSCPGTTDKRSYENSLRSPASQSPVNPPRLPSHQNRRDACGASLQRSIIGSSSSSSSSCCFLMAEPLAAAAAGCAVSGKVVSCCVK